VLTRRLTIKAVKGYAKDYQRVEAFFQVMPLLMPMPIQSSQDNVMKLALIAMGISVDEYNTSLILRLDPEIPAEQVMKEITLRLLEIMRMNTAGCIRGRDMEYMHDYRVAIRKVRVALKQLKHLDPQAAISDYMSFFSTLGRLSNPVRDRDVFLLQLENYQSNFEESGWQQLQPLRDYLLSSRAAAQKMLVKELKSSHYRDNMKNLRHYLEQDEADDNTHGRPVTTVHELADEKLWAFNQSVLEQGKTINNSDAETLHDLRKTFKQLRYLIEFFRGLYPAVELRVLNQTLVDVQDDLGEFNDRHMQANMVEAFIEQSVDEDAIEASQQIIKILRQQQDDAGKRFKSSYKSYSSSASQKKLKEMFVEYYGSIN
jgi:CHAD domain-containing protein